VINVFTITPEQVRSYDENGFLHLKNVLSEKEVKLLREEEERVTTPAMETRLRSSDYCYSNDPSSNRPVLHRINLINQKGDAFLKLYGNPALLRTAEALQGRNCLPVTICLVVKSPGYGVAVPWHRDPAHCRVRHGSNLGIYLDDATDENGMLYVVPGSHKRSDIDLQKLNEEHGFNIPGAIPVHARAGDVVVHNENVLHGSRAVRSQNKRRVFYYGIRSIEEQLARGHDVAWVKSIARPFLHAIRLRAESEIGAGETPYAWPADEQYKPDLQPNGYVELRLTE